MIQLNLLLLAFSFVAMEGVAWLTHRYMMHGFLWRIHRDHHTRENDGFFELNDLFFVIFATPGIFLIYTGSQDGWLDPKLWAGIGISLYGMAYLAMHDLFIHQRFKWFAKTDNVYLRAIRKAHRMHHKHLGPEDGECFGMLWAPWKYFREARHPIDTTGGY